MMTEGDVWGEILTSTDEDVRTVGGNEACELGRGLLALLARRRATHGDDAEALLRHALTVLEAASWYVSDALEAVEAGAELAELRGRL